jgi:hypothetical protein
MVLLLPLLIMLSLPMTYYSVAAAKASAGGAAGASAIQADRLAEFAWRTFDNPSFSSVNGTSPVILSMKPVIAHSCHNSYSADRRLNAAQAAAASLGQAWILRADKTIRVGPHSEFCLDIDGGKTNAGTPLITYTCNNVSIGRVHNQQFQYDQSNRALKSVMTGLCVDVGTGAPTSPVTMQPCIKHQASQEWVIRAPPGAPPGSLLREIVSPSTKSCLEWGSSPGSGTLMAQAYRLMERMAPFYAGVSGDQILVGCFGWLLDLVIEFTGEASQAFPFTNRDARQWSGANATYADVRDLVSALKVAAHRVGLPHLKIASLHVGWASIYDIPKGPHSLRHPEIYDSGHQFNHARAHGGALRSDKYPYASQEGGATQGQDWMQLWGNQWAAFSAFAGLEAIVIRDGFSTHANYHRGGPYGDLGAPNASVATAYIDSVRALFRATKLGAPTTKVIGYSQASSAVGEWRYGLTDVEQIVADGFIDAYIDQSWSGAWEDVPTRHSTGMGWTHQLGYILAHRAQIEGGNAVRTVAAPACNGCTHRAKHYVLHDTFDSYEGWDTLDNVPLKLMWGIWAYNHAAFVNNRTDEGRYITPDGQYLSWANSWSEVYSANSGGKSGNGNYLSRPNGLLTRPDIAFLVGALNAACMSANKLEEVFGPQIVYNRPALQRLMKLNAPNDANVNEWIDEQAGMLMKFGLPLLQVSRIELLAQQRGSSARLTGGGYVLQIPDIDTDPSVVDAVSAAAAAGTPILLSGRGDKIHPRLLKLAGATVVSNATTWPAARGLNATLVVQSGWATAAPRQVLSLSSRVQVAASPEDGGTVIASVSDENASTSAVLIASEKDKTVVWAQLNDLGGPEDVSLANFGTAGLYLAVASMMNAASETVMTVTGINSTHPATIHSWRSAGTVKILLGNLEGAYCAGTPIPSQPFGYTSGCSIPIEAQGGFAGGTRLSLEIQIVPARMGIGSQCTSQNWSLRSLDGMRAPIASVHQSTGGKGWVRFQLELEPREAHAFELMCERHTHTSS